MTDLQPISSKNAVTNALQESEDEKIKVFNTGVVQGLLQNMEKDNFDKIVEKDWEGLENKVYIKQLYDLFSKKKGMTNQDIQNLLKNHLILEKNKNYSFEEIEKICEEVIEKYSAKKDKPNNLEQEEKIKIKKEDLEQIIEIIDKFKLNKIDENEINKDEIDENEINKDKIDEENKNKFIEGFAKIESLGLNKNDYQKIMSLLNIAKNKNPDIYNEKIKKTLTNLNDEFDLEDFEKKITEDFEISDDDIKDEEKIIADIREKFDEKIKNLLTEEEKEMYFEKKNKLDDFLNDKGYLFNTAANLLNFNKKSPEDQELFEQNIKNTDPREIEQFKIYLLLKDLKFNDITLEGNEELEAILKNFKCNGNGDDYKKLRQFYNTKKTEKGHGNWKKAKNSKEKKYNFKNQEIKDEDLPDLDKILDNINTGEDLFDNKEILGECIRQNEYIQEKEIEEGTIKKQNLAKSAIVNLLSSPQMWLAILLPIVLALAPLCPFVFLFLGAFMIMKMLFMKNKKRIFYDDVKTGYKKPLKAADFRTVDDSKLNDEIEKARKYALNYANNDEHHNYQIGKLINPEDKEKYKICLEKIRKYKIKASKIHQYKIEATQNLGNPKYKISDPSFVMTPEEEKEFKDAVEQITKYRIKIKQREEDEEREKQQLAKLASNLQSQQKEEEDSDAGEGPRKKKYGITKHLGQQATLIEQQNTQLPVQNRRGSTHVW